jgi:hypothetical protein
LQKIRRGATMKHYTKDPAKRAEHIADREATDYYNQTGGNFFKKWLEIYDQILIELIGGCSCKI